MDYQELYKKYQNAVKLRDLSVDDNYSLLNSIFRDKIIDSININAKNWFIPYVAGIKEVFTYVSKEASSVDFYRDELDKVIAGK